MPPKHQEEAPKDEVEIEKKIDDEDPKRKHQGGALKKDAEVRCNRFGKDKTPQKILFIEDLR